jgi:glucokinase
VNAVGVDVGGTKIAAGVVTPEGEILKEMRYPTPNSKQRLMESIAWAITEVKDGFEVGGVCLAVPGLILAQVNKVVFSPNLRTIEGIPLKKVLEPRIRLPLTVEEIKEATLGAKSGILGAAALARDPSSGEYFRGE